jgi:hypothetical protein
MAVASPGATGLRIHFTDFKLGPEEYIYVHGLSAEGEILGPYHGRGPWDDGEFWSGTIEGDIAVIEYQSRAGADAFTISEISHLFTAADVAAPDALSCEVDAACFSDVEKNAVGRIVFVKNGDAFVCTGTLLNNRNSDFIPYFLTANHCVSTQTVARTIETYWLYQTTSCNSGVLRGDIKHTTSGADLLASDSSRDFAFVKLLDNAPAGTSFAGWDASQVALNTAVFGYHHPGGSAPPTLDSYLRRAGGTLVGTGNSCQDTGLADGYQINWSSGTTERGSSGSGLWYGQTSHYLVGVLSCGSDTGTCSGSYDFYSKFSDFYPLIQPFLSPQNTLTVASSNPPGNGVAITVSPTDDDGLNNGLTQFTRRYAANVSVTLTAPLNVTSNSFSKWQRDGVDVSTNNTVAVQMNGPHTMTAVYADTPPQTPVASSATNVITTGFTANWGNSSGAAGYRLDVSTNSSFTSYVSGYQNLDAGNVSSRNVTGLSASTTYYYRVRAYNGSATSGNSNTISQTTNSTNISVTVQTSPSGRSVTVDGTTYTAAPVTFNWIAGQSHTIGTTSSQNGSSGTRYLWRNWSDSGTISHSVTPTVSTTYTANFTTQYFLTMNSSTGGSVSPASNWYDSGAAVPIDGSVIKDYVFNSWSGAGSGSYTGPQNPVDIVINGPITETASFTQVPGTTPFAIQNGAVFGLVANVNQSYVTAEAAGAQPLIARASGPSTWEQFQVVDQGNGYVGLRSMINGKFVCADNFGASPLIANRDGAGTWEQFQLVSQGGGNFSLIARANGKYICADNNGKSPLVANRSSAGLWETFHLGASAYAISLIPSNVTVLFQSSATGQYVSANSPDGSAPLVANRSQVALWEQFRLETLDSANGIVAIRALVSGKYVTAEGAGTSALIANRPSPGTWEQFQLLDVGGGNVAFRSLINGLYVSAGNGGNQLIANRYFAGATEQFGLIVTLRSLANNALVSAPNGGANPLIANQSQIGLSEQFQFINSGDGSYCVLKARINGLYVCAENSGNSPLIANRAAYQGWEKFLWVVGGNGNVALKAWANGMYVCAESGGAGPLIANRSIADNWEQFR